MTPSDWLLWLFVFAMGAVIGSFLNVVIYRLPRGLSILQPPSHCPSCGVRLKPLDLFPVFSWAFLLAKCRYCHHHISARYPMIELASGGLACAAVALQGPGFSAAMVYIACAALLVAIFVDLDHMIIPDEVHWFVGGAGVLLDFQQIWGRGLPAMITFSERVGTRMVTMAWPRCLVGAALGATLFLILAFVAQIAFRRPALGMGDVKLAAAVGALLGPGYYFLSFFLLAALLGGVIGIVVLATSRAREDHYIPFGPMLAVSAMALALAPDTVSGIVLSRFLIY
jgi:leader peptidase (prepilin peptidase)/N-methyltransferase